MLRLAGKKLPRILPIRSLTWSNKKSSIIQGFPQLDKSSKTTQKKLHPILESNGFHNSINELLASQGASQKAITERSLINEVNTYFNKGIFDKVMLYKSIRKTKIESRPSIARILLLIIYAAFFYHFFWNAISQFYKDKWEQFQEWVDDDEEETSTSKLDKKTNTYSAQNIEERSITETEKPKRKKRRSKFQIVDVATRFSDVIGIGDERAELEEIVSFLRNPEEYSSKGARLPKGILLSGEPGVGKTLLAKAVAGEAGVPFFFLDASSVDGPFVGSGTKKLKQIFEDAKKHSPSIIFIDEIDSIGGKRASSGKYPYARHTINMLLSLMDGFDSGKNVVVIGSTNLPDILDEALTRSGRFDVTVNIPSPFIRQRNDILQFYLAKILTTVDIDVDEIARITGGMVPADLKNLCDTAGRIAVGKNNPAVTQVEIIEAIDQLTMGIGLKSKIDKVSKATMENTAWHEAGHALCSYLMGQEDMRSNKKMAEHLPVHKITIIPRGQSGGHTSFLNDDGFFYEEDLFKRLCVAYGGYVGETMYGKGLTTGPSGDFRAATNLARSIVIENLSGKSVGSTFNGIKAYEKLSDEEKERVDKEIVKVCNQAYAHCNDILTSNYSSMSAIAEALAHYHQITSKEMELIIQTGNAHGAKHLRIEEDHELNKRRIIKPKETAPKDIPAEVLLNNLKNIGKSGPDPK